MAQLVGATAAATIAAGTAAAEPYSRGESPGPGRSNSQGDTSGAHHGDPLGYHHTDANPQRQNEHWQNRRQLDYAPQTPPQTGNGGGNTNSTWNAIDNPDGAGWSVCRPQASWC
ncbi:MAG: hypothetical protein JWN03_1399 [Nocardia sp.]|uniref:hypothetical protein n=1 Tax=Nocardia sp. TaxID=1821 RepID=UPI00260E7790|nr:hypothetical protein [Nocardia sp.]MCU1641124.1 hypothetical protein [Nocardia sp.]